MHDAIITCCQCAACSHVSTIAVIPFWLSRHVRFEPETHDMHADMGHVCVRACVRLHACMWGAQLPVSSALHLAYGVQLMFCVMTYVAQLLDTTAEWLLYVQVFPRFASWTIL